MASQEWQWDSQRQQYMYWSASEGTWVCQNGERLYPSELSSDSRESSAITPYPDATSTAYVSRTAGDLKNLTQQFAESSISTGGSHTISPVSGYDTTYQTQYGLSPLDPMYQIASLYPVTSLPPVIQPIQYAKQSATDVTSHVAYPYSPPRFGPSPNYSSRTRPFATSSEIGQDSGDSFEREKLDPRYERISNPSKFFKPGRVFKILWPELAGAVDDDTTVTDDSRFGEKILAKIRWFMVVSDGRGACTAVPIHTYNDRGVSKFGVMAKEHAPLVLTGKDPIFLPGENKKELLPPLHLILEQSERLSDASRINFGKIYTIEHNTKVKSVGRIVPGDISKLKRYVSEIWDTKIGKARPGIKDDDEISTRQKELAELQIAVSDEFQRLESLRRQSAIKEARLKELEEQEDRFKLLRQEEHSSKKLLERRQGNVRQSDYEEDSEPEDEEDSEQEDEEDPEQEDEGRLRTGRGERLKTGRGERLRTERGRRVLW